MPTPRRTRRVSRSRGGRSPRGSRPAPKPIHAHTNIWYGIHGPTPAVINADANSVVQPRLKPNPGPSARPPMTSRKKISSTPAVPAPSGRSAAPIADSTPSSASALLSRPPSDTWARTTASTSSSNTPKMIGATLLAPSVEPGLTKNGQKNDTTPNADAITSATVVRGPTRTALEGFTARPSGGRTHPPGRAARR